MKNLCVALCGNFIFSLLIVNHVNAQLYTDKPLDQILIPTELSLLKDHVMSEMNTDFLNDADNIEKIKILSFFDLCLTIHDGKVIIDFEKSGVDRFSRIVDGASEDDMKILREVEGIEDNWNLLYAFKSGIWHSTAVAYLDQVRHVRYTDDAPSMFVTPPQSLEYPEYVLCQDNGDEFDENFLN